MDKNQIFMFSSAHTQAIVVIHFFSSEPTH